MRRPIVLLVARYTDPDPRRAAELAEAFARNLANPCVDAVEVFCEDQGATSSVPLHRKIRAQHQTSRVTFADLFEEAGGVFCEGERVILANADIAFDETLALLDRVPSLAGELLCLARWDPQKDTGRPWRFNENPQSADAWIFDPPLPTFRCDWFMGKLACDCRLAYEAAAAGLKLSNPGRFIRANHLHASGVRRYSKADRIEGPRLGVPADRSGKRWGL